MSYYFAKTLDEPLDVVQQKIVDALKSEGFGVLTQIDVKATFREKLDVDFPEYRILGACNPSFAHRALLAEDRIGLMLPCNVIVRETVSGGTEVAAIDPVASMSEVDNPQLEPIARDVGEKLRAVVAGL